MAKQKATEKENAVKKEETTKQTSLKEEIAKMKAKVHQSRQKRTISRMVIWITSRVASMLLDTWKKGSRRRKRRSRLKTC